MLLQNGSTGDDVKQLQSRLGLPVDGIFGADTEASAKWPDRRRNCRRCHLGKVVSCSIASRY